MASIAAQVAAGIASVLLTIAVARTQTPDSLGVFAVTLAVQGLLIGLSRSFTGDVFLFSRDAYSPDTARNILIGSASAVATLGLLVSGVSLVAAIAAGAIFQSVFLKDVLLGVSMLLLPTSLQQHLRIALIATRRHIAALGLDALGLFVVLVGAAVVTMYLVPTVTGYLCVWGVASGVYAVGALVLLRLKMRLSQGVDWLRTSWRGGMTFAADFAVTAGLTQFVVLFVSAVSGIAAAGSLRAAQTLVMPVTLVMRGAGGPLATALVRRLASGARVSAVRLCIAFSSLCLVGALLCVAWLFVPDQLLTALLGDSAGPAQAVVLPVAFATGATGLATGAGYFLRAKGELKVATLLKVLCFPLSLVAATWGGLVASAAGAQLGLMTGELTRSVLAWGVVKRRFRSHE